MANSSRVPGDIEAPNTPAHATTAVKATPTAPHWTTRTVAASASGRSEAARFGKVPTQTICISEYCNMTVQTDSTIAKGTERGGSRTSPARTVVASKPKYAKPARRTAFDALVMGGTGPNCMSWGSMKNRPTTANA